MKPQTFSEKTLQELRTTAATISKLPGFRRRKNINSDSIEIVFDEYSRHLKKIHSNNQKEFKEKLHHELDSLELFLLEHFTLYGVIFPIVDRSIKSKRKTKNNPAVQAFGFLLLNAIHNLIAIKQMLVLGLEIQALTLIRNYQETMETSVAIIVSREFLALYRSEPESEADAKIKWHAVRPEAVLKVIGQYMQKNESTAPIWEEWKTYRRQHYSRLSKGSHAQFFPLAYNAYPTPLDDEFIRGGFGGVISNALRTTLINFLVHGRLIFDMAQGEFVNHHAEVFKTLNFDKRFHLFLFKVNREMFYNSCMERWQ